MGKKKAEFLVDDRHHEIRKKKWDKWRSANWHRISSDLPANRKQVVFDALKQSFYAGFNTMYKETE